MSNPVPIEAKVILDASDAIREASSIGASLNKALFDACEGFKKGITDPDQLKAIDDLVSRYRKAVLDLQHETAINGSIVDAGEITKRIQDAGREAVEKLRGIVGGSIPIDVTLNTEIAAAVNKVVNDKIKLPQWDAKPNYDPNASSGKPMDVRVINRETDPIPTNFVKAASTISTTLFSQFSALRATVESGHTSIVQAITNGGGTGGGGGGNNTPRKTTGIITAERNIQRLLDMDFHRLDQNNQRTRDRVQFRGENLSMRELQSQLRGMIDQLNRADRQGMSQGDRETTDRLIDEARRIYDMVNNASREQTARQDQLREQWENGQLSDDQYRDALMRVYQQLRGAVNTAPQGTQSNASGFRGAEQLLAETTDNTGTLLDRLSEHITRLGRETRQSASAFGGGITGMLRDLHMIGVSLPSQASQALAMGENIFGFFKKITGNPNVLSRWERFGSSFGGNATRAFRSVQGGLSSGRWANSLAQIGANRGGMLGGVARLGSRALTGLSGGVGSTLMGGLAGAGGALATLAGPVGVLGAGAAVGMKVWEYLKEGWEMERKQRAMQDANIKQQNTMQMKMIEQRAKLEMNRINAIAELEKKRLSNQSELNRMRMEMNSADLKSQERLFAIEQRRAELRTKKEAMKQEQEFATENFNTNWEHMKTQAQKADQATLKRGMWESTFYMDDRAFTEAGERVDERLIEIATTGRRLEDEQEMLNRLLSNAADAQATILTEIKSSLDVQITQEQSILDQIASVEGAISAGTKGRIQEILKANAETRGKYADPVRGQELAWGKLLSDFASGGVGAVIGKGIKKVWDEENKKEYYITKGANGQDVVVGENEAQVAQYLQRALGSGRGKELKEEYEKDQELFKVRNEQLRQEQAIAQAEAALSDAYLHHAKAAEELKKSLRNDLFKNIVSDIQNVSKWQDSGAEKYHTRQMYGLEQQQLAQRNDPRYLRNQDAKMGLEITQAFEKQVAELLGSMNRNERRSALNPNGRIGSVQVGHEWALWEQRNIKATEALFNFQKTKTDERFKLEMEGITKRNSAEIEVINLQKELAIKTMNTALAQWKSKLDTYGKNQFELRKELALGNIDLKYARSDERFESAYKLSTADWEQKRKTQTQEKVQAVEREGLEEELAQEEALMKERQKLELDLLELEFQIRLEQIKYEVQYKAQLEKQQKEMENAEAESFLKSHGEITLEDIAKFRGKNVEDLTESEKRLTAEERIEFGKQMASTYYEGAEILRSRLAGKQVKMGDEYVDLETYEKNKRDEFLTQNEEAYNNGSLSARDKATYEALREVRDNPLTASANATALTTVFNNQRLKEFGEAYLSLGGDNPEAVAAAQEKRAELEQRKGEIDADSIFANRIKQMYEETQVTDEDGLQLRGTENVISDKGMHDFIAQKLPYGRFDDISGMVGQIDNILGVDPALLKEWADVTAQRDSMHGKDIGEEGQEGYVSYKETSQKANELRDQVFKAAGYSEDVAKRAWSTNSKEWGGFLHEIGRVAVESDAEATEQKAALDKEIETAEEGLGTEKGEEAEIKTLLESLGTDEDAATDAIYAQMDMEEKHAQTNDELLGKILVALDKGVPMRDKNGNEMKDENGETMYQNVEDVKKRLAENEAANTRARETLKQRNEQRKERVQTEEDAAYQKDSALRQSNHDVERARRENAKEQEKAREELRWNQAQRRDQMNADFIKTESKYASAQRQTDTAATLDILRAKDGNEWMKAVMKRNQDSMYNQQTAALEERHRMELEAYKNSGNVTEENTAKLEARQEQERGQLDSAKQMGDAIRESMNGVGGLRSLVTEGTGGKSSLEDTWERIQAAAFGHVMDPTADAIAQMNKAQQLNHAALMQLLAKELPAMVVNTAQMKPEAIGRMLRGVGGQIVNNNYHSAGGGLAPGV